MADVCRFITSVNFPAKRGEVFHVRDGRGRVVETWSTIFAKKIMPKKGQAFEPFGVVKYAVDPGYADVASL